MLKAVLTKLPRDSVVESRRITREFYRHFTSTDQPQSRYMSVGSVDLTYFQSNLRFGNFLQPDAIVAGFVLSKAVYFSFINWGIAVFCLLGSTS